MKMKEKKNIFCNDAVDLNTLEGHIRKKIFYSLPTLSYYVSPFSIACHVIFLTIFFFQVNTFLRFSHRKWIDTKFKKEKQDKKFSHLEWRVKDIAYNR